MISLPVIEPTHQLTFISSPALKDWSLWGIDNPKIQCNHGCNTKIPNNDHPVNKFLDTYIKGLRDATSLIDSLQTLLTTFPKIWKEETLRNEAICVLTSIATNRMLHQQHFGADSLFQVIQLSKAVITLENHNLITDNDIVTIFYHPPINAKFKCLSNKPKGSGKRDVLKFLSRRISCSCLKEMYRQARLTIPKSRHCEYCKEMKERDELMLCGGCRLIGYCSTECQEADWKREHRQICLGLSGYQNAYANQIR